MMWKKNRSDGNSHSRRVDHVLWLFALFLVVVWAPVIAQEAATSSEVAEVTTMSSGCSGCGNMHRAGAGMDDSSAEQQQATGQGCCAGMKGAGMQGAGMKSHGAGGGCQGMGAGKASAEAGCGMCGQGMGSGGAMADQGCKMCGQGSGRARGKGQGMGGGGNHGVMQSAMTLVHNRSTIEREVEEIEGGIRTITRVAGDPEMRKVLITHVAQVSQMLSAGGRVRNWDPLFAEIFDHYDEIEMKIEEIEDGVIVTETSSNPEVAKLIRAHAYKVNDFLARGHEAVHEATPLPSDYSGR